MANICEITGKKVLFGNRVSKANNKTNRKFYPNLQKKRFFSPELNCWILLNICSKAMRTINKKGLHATIKQAAKKGTLAPRLVSFLPLI